MENQGREPMRDGEHEAQGRAAFIFPHPSDLEDMAAWRRFMLSWWWLHLCLGFVVGGLVASVGFDADLLGVSLVTCGGALAYLSGVVRTHETAKRGWFSWRCEGLLAIGVGLVLVPTFLHVFTLWPYWLVLSALGMPVMFLAARAMRARARKEWAMLAEELHRAFGVDLDTIAKRYPEVD